jgi:glycosyltransferase 2 family protein
MRRVGAAVTRVRRLYGARHGYAALAIAVTFGFAYIAVRDVELDELADSLRGSNYWWLVPALAILALAFFVRALRWHVLFSPSTRPGLWPTTQALLVGQFFNNVLPLRAGDAARILALHALGGRSRAEAAGTVVIERVFDVLALLVLFFVGLPWFPEVTWLHVAGPLAIALLLVLAAAVVVLRVYGERPLRFVLRPLARLPFLFPERVEALARNLTHGLIGLRSARLGAIAFGWTLLSWLLVAVSFWLVMLGFDLGLGPTAGLLAVVATGLSMILPSGPAALGVFEGAAVIALTAYGVGRADALSYALVVHAVNVLPFIVAGLVVVNVYRGAVTRARSRKRRQERLGARRRLHGSPGAGVGVRRGSGGTGDDQDDVAQPADRHPEVDELREPR